MPQTTPFEPHITVACIVQHQNKFLMVEEYAKSENLRPVLNQPAGHVEANETLIEAAIRETKEETACIVKPTHLLGWYVYKAPNNATYYRACFIADLIEQLENTSLDPDIIQTHWMSPEELDQRKADWRSPLTGRCVSDFLSGQRFSLSSIYEHSN